MSATRLELPDLAGIRQQRGISLGQISDTTKIGRHYLEQIERGQFAKLPGGIYNTSYIRQYARAIGYPEDHLLRVYRNAYLPKLALAICGSD